MADTLSASNPISNLLNSDSNCPEPRTMRGFALLAPDCGFPV